MTYEILTQTNLPISLSDAKEHLRVTHNLEDTQIEAYTLAAINFAQNYTGRAFSTMEIKAVEDLALENYVITKWKPIDTIDSVEDKNGPIDWTFDGFDTVTIVTEDIEGPVTITYTTNSSNVDATAVTAMLLKTREFYDYRSDRYVPLNREGMARTVAELLLQPFKLVEFV